MNRILRQVFELYKTVGNKTYIGETINQIQHGAQAALLAEKQGYSKTIILAAFLHDIGNLVPHRNTINRTNQEIQGLGTYEHEKIGATFLRSYFFPEEICELVENHVQTKRYKLTTDKTYYNTLSEASKKTFEIQGGLMTTEELIAFRNNPLYDVHLKLREWDDLAKLSDSILLAEIEKINPVEKYYEMACEVVPHEIRLNN